MQIPSSCEKLNQKTFLFWSNLSKSVMFKNIQIEKYQFDK